MDKLLGIASFGVYCVYGLHAWTVAISDAEWETTLIEPVGMEGEDEPVPAPVGIDAEP